MSSTEPSERHLERYLDRLWEPSPKGPDVLLVHHGKKVWIECVAPGAGSGELQAEPLPASRVIAGDPHGENIILRITSALADKAKQTKTHIDTGLIAPDEPVVIAISLASVSTSGAARLQSYCLRALYGTGQPIFMVSTEEPQKPIRLDGKRSLVLSESVCSE